jgi:nucleoside-diphosphate-sugar epimerase
LPLSLYARTKVASETVLLDLTQPTFAPTILRFGTIYGLSGRPRFDLVVNLLAAKAIQDGEAGIYGGNQWRPLVHVRDVGEAIALTLEAPLVNVSGQIFNVGSNEQNYQIAELGRIIQDMVPAARVVMQPQEDNRNYRVRFDKIYRTLNFRPRYTVRDGVAEIVRAFATGAIRDYRDPRYSNYAYLHANDELQHSLLASARDHSMDVRTLIGEEAA